LSFIAAWALIHTPVAADPPGGITCLDLLNTTHECGEARSTAGSARVLVV
jgi:hypothetical protein